MIRLAAMLLSLILCHALTTGMAFAAYVEEIDAKDGRIYSEANTTFKITSNSGSGEGVALMSAVVKIDALRHEDMLCAAVVRLAASEILRFNSVYVANELSTLTFSGTDSTGLGPADETWQKMLISVGDGAKVILEAPLNADTVRKEGAGTLLVSSAFSSKVTNVAGQVYFVLGDDNRFGLKTGGPFVFKADCSEVGVSELQVERARNGNKSLDVEVTSDLAADRTEVMDVLVGGGHDVTVDAGITLYQSDVIVEPEDYLDAVPECAVVGSNSVGVLRIAGSFLGKLAIADGAAANARGAVYVAPDATVSNYSETAAAPLLGRHGYAGLLVAGGYTAFGAWQGGVDGQLFMKIAEGGSFVHADSRTSSFSLGGSDASVALLASGGTFDASDAVGDVALPLAGDAAEVVLTAENEGLIDLGEKTLTANAHVRVNLNSGGTLSANALAAKDDASDPAIVSFDGGYLRALAEGNPFDGTTSAHIYAHAGGAGFDVPFGKTAQIGDTNKPLAPTGQGVASIALGDALTDRTFAGPPIVKILDDDGKGATAVAELTDGAVTAIRVTSPGVGYTGATAKLLYGTEEIALGAVTLADNAVGPLLKRGEGTLEVNAETALAGLQVYGGTVRLGTNYAVQEGPLYIAEGATLDVGSTTQRFSDFRGHASIAKESEGAVELTGLTVDMTRVKAGDIDTLDLGKFTLTDSCRITLTNFSNLDRVTGNYVIYHLTGDLPATAPTISEATYAAGLSRNWSVKLEGKDLVLRYIGGSIFMFY